MHWLLGHKQTTFCGIHPGDSSQGLALLAGSPCHLRQTWVLWESVLHLRCKDGRFQTQTVLLVRSRA